MRKGKQTCSILKKIRQHIAEANDINYITINCPYKGDCLGTCPQCEAEVRYLEEQLEQKRISGRAIALIGISAGILSMAPLSAVAQQVQPIDSLMTLKADSIPPLTEEEFRELSGVVEMLPEFPNGGMAGLMHFLEENTRYPDPELSLHGYVVVQFSILKDGNIGKTKVIQSLHPLFDEEILRVINSMPKWKPGKVREIPVEVTYTLPIQFTPKEKVKEKQE